MIENLLSESDISISVIPEWKYKKITDGLKKQIKGKSSYEEDYIVSELPRNKEFYVINDFYRSYEDGSDEWCITIATTYKGMYLSICDCGGN